MKLNLPVGEAIKFGWRTIWSNIGFFLLFSIVYFIIEFGFPLIIQTIVGSPSGVQTPGALYTTNTPQLSGTSIYTILLISLLNLVVTIVATVYFTRVTLLFVDGKRPSIREIFSYPIVPAALKLAGGTILFYLVILIIPAILLTLGLTLSPSNPSLSAILGLLGLVWVFIAIYLALRYSLFSYPIIDRGEGIIKAFKLSARMTHTTKLRLLGLIILLALINILGALAIGIGLLVTIPMTMLAMAYTYRTLRSQVEKTTAASFQPPTQPTSPTAPPIANSEPTPAS